MQPTTHNPQTSGTKRKAAHYHAHIRGPRANTQAALVVQVLEKIGQPTTVRNLHKIINGRGYIIDLVSLRRAVTNLLKPDPKGRWQNPYGRQMLYTAHERPCPITHVTVGWYQLLPQPPQQTQLFN